MAELKPCPFCGGNRAEVINALESQPELELVGLAKDNWNVICPDCFGHGGYMQNGNRSNRSMEQEGRRWEMKSG